MGKVLAPHDTHLDKRGQISNFELKIFFNLFLNQCLISPIITPIFEAMVSKNKWNNIPLIKTTY